MCTAPAALLQKVTADYSLTSDNELKMTFAATSDKATPINICNHTYWNLSGDLKSKVRLRLRADWRARARWQQYDSLADTSQRDSTYAVTGRPPVVLQPAWSRPCRAPPLQIHDHVLTLDCPYYLPVDATQVSAGG